MEDDKTIENKMQPLSEAEKDKQRDLIAKMFRARDERDESYEEFDEMTLPEWVEYNAKTANSYIPPRKNATDVSIISGEPKSKLRSLASYLYRMNFKSDVLAFDKNDDEDIELGRTLSNLVFKAKELDNNEEKFIQRLMQLLEQGTVFVEEVWRPNKRMKKKIQNRANLDPATGFEGLKWLEEYTTEYKAERNILDLTQVYLGNMREYFIENQPYLFTRVVKNYDVVKTQFGGWKNWQYVHKGGAKSVLNDEEDDTLYRDFRLYDLQDDQVEIITYQDPINDEYQIFINGVMMLPIEFPCPWEWEGFNISKAVFDIISPFFPYGKSFISQVGIDGEILDEMLRMFIHKTKQSIKPPTGNLTGKNLDPRIFDAGTIWKGVNAAMLAPLVTHQGVTSSEFQMYEMLKDTISRKTFSDVFQGQQAQAGTTATEIMETQRQAQINLGLTMLSVTLMEEKVDKLVLNNVLSNWTKPIDTEVDEVNQKLKKKYKKINIQGVNIDGRDGVEKVEFDDSEPSGDERIKQSFDMYKEDKKQDKPFKRTIIHLPLLNKMKYKFYIKCNPSQRESDNLNKILFREKMDQLMTYFPQSINMDYQKKRWAQAWGENAADTFTEVGMQAMESAVQQQSPSKAKEVTKAATKGMNPKELMQQQI